ncbi:MAG: type III-B CRISPR module-associated protein Cmr5 [Verrucomicrobia bacterium]|nr:type III-B CRISPR module-associated protein Cmr5 [Verrucomicrobiota bacterium]
MKNLEQLRAAAALAPSQNLDRSAISKLPALILSNGLLATSAFCISDGGGDNKKDMKRALDATAGHLAARGLIGAAINSANGIITDLSARDAIDLQRATSEALAFLAYLKRFAEKKN